MSAYIYCHLLIPLALGHIHHCVQSHMVWLPCVGSVLERASSAFCQEHMLHILSGMCVNIIVQAINHFFLHQLIHIGLIEMPQPEVPNGR